MSTFSVDADGASYAIMRRYLARGYEVNPSSVRIEEFLNYFTFDYPHPPTGDEQLPSMPRWALPLEPGHQLLRWASRDGS